jgi:predicted RNA-binding Zn ribbon-like protein
MNFNGYQITARYERMSETRQKPASFELCAGHPALDFVNSLDDRFVAGSPVELLTRYEDLLRFMGQTRLLGARQLRALARLADSPAAARALRAARELREAMATTLYGKLAGRLPLPADIHTLERHFLDADRHRTLCWQPARDSRGPAAMRWEWSGGETNPDLPVWILARQASQLMTSHALAQVRACGAETCRWLFLDTSKNHTRRWCNMKMCGNRMKARRFQARHG